MLPKQKVILMGLSLGHGCIEGSVYCSDGSIYRLIKRQAHEHITFFERLGP